MFNLLYSVPNQQGIPVVAARVERRLAAVLAADVAGYRA